MARCNTYEHICITYKTRVFIMELNRKWKIKSYILGLSEGKYGLYCVHTPLPCLYGSNDGFRSVYTVFSICATFLYTV